MVCPESVEDERYQRHIPLSVLFNAAMLVSRSELKRFALGRGFIAVGSGSLIFKRFACAVAVEFAIAGCLAGCVSFSDTTSVKLAFPEIDVPASVQVVDRRSEESKKSGQRVVASVAITHLGDDRLAPMPVEIFQRLTGPALAKCAQGDPVYLTEFRVDVERARTNPPPIIDEKYTGAGWLLGPFSILLFLPPSLITFDWTERFSVSIEIDLRGLHYVGRASAIRSTESPPLEVAKTIRLAMDEMDRALECQAQEPSSSAIGASRDAAMIK
jgi:hypothetical protein